MENLCGPRPPTGKCAELALFLRSSISTRSEDPAALCLKGDNLYSILPPNTFCIKLEIWGRVSRDGNDKFERLVPANSSTIRYSSDTSFDSDQDLVDLFVMALPEQVRQRFAEKRVESFGFVTKSNELELDVNLTWAYGTLLSLWRLIHIEYRAFVLVYADLEEHSQASVSPWEIMQVEGPLHESPEDDIERTKNISSGAGSSGQDTTVRRNVTPISGTKNFPISIQPDSDSDSDYESDNEPSSPVNEDRKTQMKGVREETLMWTERKK
ncbi:hypothetical protein BDV97DRAFT_422597 [Delphinella strobiligena]|nr:hypothetical protein BDV97DRAFT_422597 [Delphinella strobiligena]